MKTIKSIIITGMLATVIAAGCTGGGGVDLDGSQWLLVEINGAPALPGSGASLNFEGAQVNGKASCNSFFGEVKYGPGDAISFDALGSTMMACLEPEGLMEQESAYLQALGDAVSFEVEGGTLKLMDGDGTVLLEFESLE
ncbi:MAG: META domain-containing protein [Anaerolineae bacterium]|nr:META domain-containing protein [Anaerolineae bacterium]